MEGWLRKAIAGSMGWGWGEKGERTAGVGARKTYGNSWHHHQVAPDGLRAPRKALGRAKRMQNAWECLSPKWQYPPQCKAVSLQLS